MRLWLSGPRILNGLVRPGISLGREDLHPRLPAWRRYELRHGLQEAAKARGETFTRADADYAIDKALSTGGLDSAGNLHVQGTRDKLPAQIMKAAAAWGQPVTRQQAEQNAAAAIAATDGNKTSDKMVRAFAYAAAGVLIAAVIAAMM